MIFSFQLGWSLPFAWAGIWILITFPWVQAELRHEKKTWGRIHHSRFGEPFTDDITANPRTRMNSFQARILPFINREKQTSRTSSLTTDQVGTVHVDHDNTISDHATRSGDDHSNFPGAVTSEEGTIGAGGLERSASRPVHNPGTTMDSHAEDNHEKPPFDHDLEKQ